MMRAFSYLTNFITSFSLFKSLGIDFKNATVGDALHQEGALHLETENSDSEPAQMNELLRETEDSKSELARMKELLRVVEDKLALLDSETSLEVKNKFSQFLWSVKDFIIENPAATVGLTLMSVRVVLRYLTYDSQVGLKSAVVATSALVSLWKELEQIVCLDCGDILVSQSGSCDSSLSDSQASLEFIDRVAQLVFGFGPGPPLYEIEDGKFVFEPAALLYLWQRWRSAFLTSFRAGDFSSEDEDTADEEEDSLCGLDYISCSSVEEKNFVLDSQSGTRKIYRTAFNPSHEDPELYRIARLHKGFRRLIVDLIELEMFNDVPKLVLSPLTKQTVYAHTTLVRTIVRFIRDVRCDTLQEDDSYLGLADALPPQERSVAIDLLIDRVFDACETLRAKTRPRLDAAKSFVRFVFGFPTEKDAVLNSFIVKSAHLQALFPQLLDSVTDSQPVVLQLDDAHSKVGSLASTFRDLMSEDDQIDLALHWFKDTGYNRYFRNQTICGYCEIDLLLRYREFAIAIECKRSMSPLSRNKGRKQLQKVCNGLAMWDKRVIGILYTPIGFEVVCDEGSPNVDISQILLSVKDMAGAEKIVECLNSQAYSVQDTPKKSSAPPARSVVVNAGAHHLSNQSISDDSDSPFSMNRIYADQTTAKADIKMIEQRMSEAARTPFAGGVVSASGGSNVSVPASTSGLLSFFRGAPPVDVSSSVDSSASDSADHEL